MESVYYYRQGNMQMPGGQGRGGPMPQPQQYMQNQNPSYRGGQENIRTKRSHKPSKQNVPQPQEDRDEPSGDELDDISARDIAMARYKRNHDYLSEIFTPYTADSIVPPALDISQNKEDLLNIINEQKQKAKEQQEQHNEKIKQFNMESEKFWNSLNLLNDANTIEKIEKAAQEIAETLESKLEHHTENVYATQIPGLKDEPIVPRPAPQQPQQPQPSQMATQPSQQPTTPSQQSSPSLQQASAINQSHLPSSIQQQQQQSHQQQQPQQSQQQHMTSNDDDVDMYTNFDHNPSNDDDDNNDFFNEMVNTGQDDDDDDGPSVSEFLNSDMDYEQSEKQDDEK